MVTYQNDNHDKMQNEPTEAGCPNYALKPTIMEIVTADSRKFSAWEHELAYYVQTIASEDNATRKNEVVSESQKRSWQDCFSFIAKHLNQLHADQQAYELIFEYSLPGTVHERPDVIILTEQKVISLEFKRKQAPQIDDNKDDVAQAIRYKEWLENHHDVTKEKGMSVESYLVCTHENAKSGNLRGIEVLTKDNFSTRIATILSGEKPCSFVAEWVSSRKTEMPDMLKAIGILYGEKRIPYLSDVNEQCLKSISSYISQAKERKRKVLILIQGVPGAGKTAVGQSVVFENIRDGKAIAVYLSGNGPLVEVLQYQIDKASGKDDTAINAVQGMKAFKESFFDNDNDKYKIKNPNVPEQSILVFDEAQRAWDDEKTKRGISEPEGLLRIGNKIYDQKGYAVIVGLYGNGQAIHTGEEIGLSLWENALNAHSDWCFVASENLLNHVNISESQKVKSNNTCLPVSLRADFIDCSEWVEQAIGRHGTIIEAKAELSKLQKTSLRICMTRDFKTVRNRVEKFDHDHPDWKYGIIISDFAEQKVINKVLPGWEIGFCKKNELSQGKNQYGPWFAGDCKKLEKACSVFGCQGLELDCPIVLFGGEYIRQNGTWKTSGTSFNSKKNKYHDPDSIVENNFRVLLTRARKEMILVIPKDPILDETYQYFVDMGLDIL